jgi:nucleoid DNA-binding protein
MENKEIIYKTLLDKYNITITKKELAQILSSSISFIDKCIMKGENIPNFKKLGNSKNSKIIFNLMDVVDFLTNTTRVYHN